MTSTASCRGDIFPGDIDYLPRFFSDVVQLELEPELNNAATREDME